jgi:hypothetical protein
MTDIVERLREWPRSRSVVCKEAADEIERLRKLLFDITVSWHCGPASADSDDLAKLIEGYDAHSVPGPWNDANLEDGRERPDATAPS